MPLPLKNFLFLYWVVSQVKTLSYAFLRPFIFIKKILFSHNIIDNMPFVLSWLPAWLKSFGRLTIDPLSR